MSGLIRNPNSPGYIKKPGLAAGEVFMVPVRTWLVLTVLFLAIGCGGPSATSRPVSSNMTPVQAHEWLQGKNPPQLIDVRNPDEFQTGHIAGAKLIPLGELEGRLGDIDKGKPVLLYCLAGVRSQKAADLLNRHSFQNVFQITGGVKAWREVGLPLTAATPPSTPK